MQRIWLVISNHIFYENIYMLHKYNHESFIIIIFLFSSYGLRNLSKHDTDYCYWFVIGVKYNPICYVSLWTQEKDKQGD